MAAVIKVALGCATLLLLSAGVRGINCYSCLMSGGAVDTSCLDDVTSQREISCPTALYCVVKRIDYAQQSNTIFSFERGCSPQNYVPPLFINETIEDSQFNTHFTSCKWADKCNTGDGKWKGGNSGGAKPPSIGVPGIGRGATSSPSSWLLGTLLICMFRRMLM